MATHAPLLATVHLLLTAGFVVVTFALLGVSVVNRLRIRNTVVSWRPVSWHAFPIGPMVFGALLVGFEAVALLSGRSIPAFLLVGYGSGTLAWFAAAYLSSVVVVSECGVVADIHRRDLAISWRQVTDYFEFERGRRRGFVFLFKDEDGTARRMEVDVPRRLMPLLREHIACRLKVRFESASERVSGKRALEG
jgi:hypothetical protein